MEKQLYKALALVLLESRQDQWGNTIQSPLAEAINKWSNENREDIASAVVKKLTKEKLADSVSEKVVKELSKTSSWQTNYAKDQLNELVMNKVADALAEEKLKEIKKSYNN